MGVISDSLIDDGNCFACGPNNPAGLRLRFSMKPGSGKAVCHTSIADHFNGWKGVVHGGIVTTLLDETMVYACTSTGWFTVTGSIEVKFHKPVPTGVPLTVTGRVHENRGRCISASGTIEFDGKVLVSSKAVLIPVSHDENAMNSLEERLEE